MSERYTFGWSDPRGGYGMTSATYKAAIDEAKKFGLAMPDQVEFIQKINSLL